MNLQIFHKFITTYTQSKFSLLITPECPESLNQAGILFLCLSRDNPTEPDEILVGDIASLEASHYQANGNLKILVHGFGGNFTHGFPREMKNGNK